MDLYWGGMGWGAVGVGTYICEEKGELLLSGIIVVTLLSASHLSAPAPTPCLGVVGSWEVLGLTWSCRAQGHAALTTRRTPGPACSGSPLYISPALDKYFRAHDL